MSRLKKDKLVYNRFNKDSDVCKQLVDKINVESRCFPTPDSHCFRKRSFYNYNQSLKTHKLLCDDIVIETKGHFHKFCCTEEATEESNLFSAFKRIGNGLWHTILCYKTDWYEKI